MTSPEPPGQEPRQPPSPAFPYGYPPAPYYPPQPPPSGPSTWFWIALASLVGLAAVALIGGLVFIFSSLGDPDSADEYYVTDREVSAALEEPCRVLEDAVADLRPFGPEASGADDLAAVADAARAVATAINAAGEGADVLAFGGDWTMLADALDEYAGSLDDPAARFDLPRIEGDYVSDRIFYGNDDCYVPVQLETLDPQAAEDLYGL